MSDDLPSAFPPDTPWWAKLLVENVRDCWRWTSVRISALVVVAPMLLEYAPQATPLFSSLLTPTQEHYLISALGLLALLGRITKQTAAQ